MIIVPHINNAYAAVRNSFPCIPGLSPVQLGTLVTALSQLLYLTIIVAVMPRSDIIKILSLRLSCWQRRVFHP